MRLFSEITREEDIILSEGILSKISDIFGTKSARVIGGIKSFSKNTKDLPTKVRAIYKITLSSINDIVDKNERNAVEALISSYEETTSLDEIVQLNYNYLMKDRYPKSRFTQNLNYFTKELCAKSKNPQIRAYLKDLSKLSKNQEVEEEIKKKVEKELTKKATKKDDIPVKKKDEEESKPTVEKNDKPVEEITKQEVVNIVKTDPIKDLSEKVNIDSNKLYSTIFQKVADDKSLIDDADDVILGLSAIVCGALLLKDSAKIKPVLQSIGIDESDEFIKNIEKVAN